MANGQNANDFFNNPFNQYTGDMLEYKPELAYFSSPAGKTFAKAPARRQFFQRSFGDIYNQYLNGEIGDPGFTLNTAGQTVNSMVLNTTNGSLYTVDSSGLSVNQMIAPFNGQYTSWGELMGKVTCELIHCSQQCLMAGGLVTDGGAVRPTPTPDEDKPTKPLSKANKLVIDRMIKKEVKKTTTSLPKVVSKYVLPDKKAVAINVLLTALEKEFGILRNMSGTVSDMREAILREPMNLSNESVLNGNTKMGLLPGWYKTPNNLSQSVANAWMTIADMRNAVSDIQKNFFGNTTCQDIVYDVKGSLATTQTGIVTGIKLDFSGMIVRLPFKDCGAEGCKVTVEDTDFNSITKYVNVVAESRAKGGTTIAFSGSNINTASNYKVTVDMCFTDGDSQCAKSVQFNVENNQSCPAITFPKANKDSITFKITGVNGSAYDLSLICEGQGGGEFGRRVYDAPKNIINGQFTGLPAGKTFNIYAELKSKGSGIVTKCPTISTSTIAPVCVTSNVLSSEFKSKASFLVGKSLSIACYNDSSVTYATKAGFDADGNFIVVKCGDCNMVNCEKGEPITSYGSFISDTSSTPLVIKSRLFASTVGAGKEDSGAYAVNDRFGQKVLYLFVEEDDADRYAMMLEERGYPEMSIIEVDDRSAIGICEHNGYRYSIITKDDIVIPPDDVEGDLNDLLPKD